LTNSHPDYAAEIRRTLVNPRQLCKRLGIDKGAVLQNGSGITVRCPIHGDRTPSCSVTSGRDGTIRFKCFGCQATGDALTLIAATHGLDVRREFKELLLESAEIAGLSAIVDELNNRKPYTPRPLPEMPDPEPERDYPDSGSVQALWDSAEDCSYDQAASAHLTERRISPVEASRLALVRVLDPESTQESSLPRWAYYGATSWLRSGHRMLVRMFDSTGTLRSLRAWRIEGDCPAKRLPPKGCRATGLVMANERGQKLLSATRHPPTRILITEGEPDTVTWSVARPDLPVIGIIIGSWGPAFAERVPTGSEVIVRTHNDPAGDKYASQVIESVKGRAIVLRSEAFSES
jgi:hypothetical protein